MIGQRLGHAAGEARLAAVALEGARIFDFFPRALKPELRPLGPSLDLAHPRLAVGGKGDDGGLQQIDRREGHHPSVLIELPFFRNEADRQSSYCFFLEQEKCLFRPLNSVNKELTLHLQALIVFFEL